MESKKRVTVYLSQEALIQLRKQAKDKGTSRSAQLENLILGRNVDVTYNPKEYIEDMRTVLQEELKKVMTKLKDIQSLVKDNISPSGYQEDF